MANKGNAEREKVIRGTGNIFADLGFADAGERQTKLRLAYAINKIVEGCRRRSAQCEPAQDIGASSLQIGWIFGRETHDFSHCP